MQNPPALSVGATIAGYRIEAEVGRGGMGIVYRATQLALERAVALKLIAPHLSADERFRERFQSEARVAASIDHPNILPIYEAGEADGSLFLSMRYIEGGDLGTLVEQGPMAPERVVGIVSQVAEALAAAHERGLVHRDVKPSNVLLEERDGTERAYLADFGLAKVSASQSGLTKSGLFVGTLDYLAPEQLRGEPLDRRADVYALGCLLYQALTGHVPYPHEDELAKLWAHLHEPPPAPSARVPGLSPGLDEVVRRAMAKKPEQRFETTIDLRNALASATTAAPRASFFRLSKRTVYALATALLLIVAAAVAVGLLARGGGDPPTRAQPVVVQPNSVVVIDPGTGRVVASIPVGDGPSAIDVEDGLVWVLSRDAQTISLVDASTKKLVKTFGAGAQARALAVGADSVWVGKTGNRLPSAEFDAGRAPGSVEQLDASDGAIVRTIAAPPLPPPPASIGDMGAVAFGADAAWFLSGNQTVSRIDAASATVVARIRFEGQVSGIDLPSLAAGEDGVWVSAGGGVPGGVLTRIDPTTNEQATTLEVPGEGPVVAGLGGVWIADQWYDSQSVWQIDPGVNRVVRSIRVGPLPLSIALGEGAVWVTTSDGMVSKIDPTSSKVIRQIRVGGTPFGIAVGEGFVWVARV